MEGSFEKTKGGNVLEKKKKGNKKKVNLARRAYFVTHCKTITYCFFNLLS
jgi:hypothetical protein